MKMVENSGKKPRAYLISVSIHLPLPYDPYLVPLSLIPCSFFSILISLYTGLIPHHHEFEDAYSFTFLSMLHEIMVRMLVAKSKNHKYTTRKKLQKPQQQKKKHPKNPSVKIHMRMLHNSFFMNNPS